MEDADVSQNGALSDIGLAAAYGDLAAVQDLVQAHFEKVNEPDCKGYSPLQWAALNNRSAVVAFLLEKGANLHWRDSTGQTALHWTAVRGSVSCLEQLLRAGADINALDSQGYTVCHVAAQHGQTGVLYHLAMRWSADIDAPDTSGRAPLHWAAYKGHTDVVRLLVVMEAQLSAKDCEGCTALHWAAIRGNGEVCRALLQAGAKYLLTHVDVTESTPVQLANAKGHRMLALFLADQHDKYERESRRKHSSTWLSQLVALQLAPVIWALIVGLLFVFVHKVWKLQPLPQVSGSIFLLCWSAVALASVGLWFLYKTTSSDPGSITAAGDPAMSKRQQSLSPSGTSTHSAARYAALDVPALWAGHWNQLCVTCKIVRPLRAKHDAVTNRCIEVFDHYCPWVGNAIGKGNRHYFLIFLWCELFAMVFSATVAGMRLRELFNRTKSEPAVNSGDLVWLIAFLVVDGFVMISVAVLAITQAHQVSRNLTTNEMANWYRYSYLHAPDGIGFHNPFDRGCWRNCVDTCTPGQQPMAPTHMDAEKGSHSLTVWAPRHKNGYLAKTME